MSFIRRIKKKNGIYLAEVMTYRENGKVKQKVIRYIGKEVNGKPMKRIRTDQIDKVIVKHHGQVYILLKLFKELGLHRFISNNIQHSHPRFISSY